MIDELRKGVNVLYKNHVVEWDISDFQEIEKSNILEVVKPLKITIPRLENLGFSNDGHNNFTFVINERAFIVISKIGYSYYLGGFNLEISFIHEIQNIIYSLSKQKVKLT